MEGEWVACSRKAGDTLGDVCNVGEVLLCFFKQKTAYEMLRSLVGSEMCIRDRIYVVGRQLVERRGIVRPGAGGDGPRRREVVGRRAVSYTHLTLPTIYSV